MTTIQMQAAQDATKNIRSVINAQTEIIASYTGFINQLRENWSGAGYESFVTVFNNMSPKVKAMFNNIDEYNNRIISLQNEMQDSDNSCAQLFEKV